MAPQTLAARSRAGAGSFFKLAMDGIETILHAFTGGTSDGGTPFAGVTKGQNGILYGATFAGGVGNKGVIFSVKTKN
jgi:uncharacterized repeat protein (TIGR03803 family)